MYFLKLGKLRKVHLQSIFMTIMNLFLFNNTIVIKIKSPTNEVFKKLSSKVISNR